MEKIIATYPWMPILISVVLLWSVPWKGAALWRSARRGHMGWFIALLLLNTLAILDILYIFIFSKMGEKPGAPVEQVPPKPQPMPNQNNRPIV